MTWRLGQDVVNKLLADGELDRVEPSTLLAERLIQEAENHLESAEKLKGSDASGAYQLAYDAARKGCAALLAQQGLRSTTRGGHIAIQDCVRAQFGAKSGYEEYKEFAHLRRGRNDREYPKSTTPQTDVAEVEEAISSARGMFEASTKILGSGKLDRYA